MQTTLRLVSGLLVVPAAAAACAYFMIQQAEKAFCRLLGQAIEQALSILFWFFELLVSQLDGFIANPVLP